MLGIRYNNIFFDLYPNSTITLELNNPIFDDDILKGNYSFPFKIPLTPRNQQLLNIPNEPGSPVNFNNAIIVDLYIEGLLLFPQGELRIKIAFETYAEIFILIGVSSFAAFANITNVADVMDYVKVLSNDIHETDVNKICGKVAEQSLLATVDTLPYIFFPVVNNGNYPQDQVNYKAEDKDYLVQDIIYNLYMHNDVSNAAFFSVASTQDFEKFPPLSMVPFFYVTYVLRKILQNVQVGTNIFEADAELKKLCLLNNFCLDNYVFDIYGYAPGITPPFPLYEKTNTGGRNIEARNHVPAMLISDFLLNLKKTFCLYLFKDPFSAVMHFHSMNSLLDDAAVVDWTRITYPSIELNQDIDSGIAYNPAAGNDAVISTNPSTEKENVVYLGNSNFPPVAALIGELFYAFDNASYYKWNGTKWDYFAHGFGDYYMSPKKFEVTPAFTGSPDIDVAGKTYTSHDFKFYIPSMNLPGSYYKRTKYITDPNLELPEVVVNPNGMKLAFYRGMTTPDANYPLAYPLGSSNNYFKNVRTGNYSLAFLGDDGLYAKWWKKYLNFRYYTKIRKVRIKLDLLSLLNLNMRKKVSIDGQHYFIKKLSLQLPLTKPVEAELWKAGNLENISQFPNWKPF